MYVCQVGVGDHVHGYIKCVRVCQVGVDDHVHGYINCTFVRWGWGIMFMGI